MDKLNYECEIILRELLDLREKDGINRNTVAIAKLESHLGDIAESKYNKIYKAKSLPITLRMGCLSSLLYTIILYVILAMRDISPNWLYIVCSILTIITVLLFGFVFIYTIYEYIVHKIIVKILFVKANKLKKVVFSKSDWLDVLAYKGYIKLSSEKNVTLLPTAITYFIEVSRHPKLYVGKFLSAVITILITAITVILTNIGTGWIQNIFGK